VSNQDKTVFPLTRILDRGYAEWLDSLTLVKNCSTQEKRIWDIYVNAQTYIEPKKIYSLERKIEEKLSDLEQVNIKISYNQLGMDFFRKNFSKFWRAITEDLRQDQPSLNGWIDHCIATLHNNEIELYVHHPVAFELFQIKNIDIYIKNWMVGVL
jgi:DNA polymerase-3 subunit alpha (Gram-positive type)